MELELVERLRASGLAGPGLPSDTAARWVLTITDAFYGRGYPEPDRDRVAEVATAKQLIGRVLHYTGSTVAGVFASGTPRLGGANPSDV